MTRRPRHAREGDGRGAPRAPHEKTEGWPRRGSPFSLRRGPFALRLITFSTLLICISVGLSSYLVQRSHRAELTKRLGRELLAMARSSAALVDGDLVDLVHRSQDGEIAFPEEFAVLRGQLDRVRRANGLPDRGSPLYIMRAADDFETSGLLEFVAMPDRDEQGAFFVGNQYPAEPHNLRALAGEAAASPLYEDSEGIWISAAAPVFDSEGRQVGLLQVDREVAYVLARARSEAWSIWAGAGVSVVLGALFSIAFARGLVRPIERIAAAVRTLGEGDLRHRVEIDRHDEIGELARGVNRMAANLESAREAQEATSRALATSGRLAAVGELAAGVAHEINNPLTYARTNLSILLQHWDELVKQARAGEPLPPDSPLVEEGEAMLGESLEGVDRALFIVRDVKGLAHAGAEGTELVDLGELIEGVLRVASPQLGPGVSIVRHFGTLPMVDCAGQELKQVFLNLILNANHAIGDTGTLTVTTEAHAGAVHVHVMDDGGGIEEKNLVRIFDPFFTTKPVGTGTGLGLAISYEIVRRHGGEIEVRSRPGVGSRFTVVLPVRAALRERREEEAAQASTDAVEGCPREDSNL